jgi:hypothetical protein
MFKELGILSLESQYLFSFLLFASYNKALFLTNFDSHTYIHIHSMDPKSVKKTVGCGISLAISGTHTQYNRSYSTLHTHTHTHTHTHINVDMLSTYTVYTNLYEDESVLDTRNSSTE